MWSFVTRISVISFDPDSTICLKFAYILIIEKYKALQIWIYLNQLQSLSRDLKGETSREAHRQLKKYIGKNALAESTRRYWMN